VADDGGKEHERGYEGEDGTKYQGRRARFSNLSRILTRKCLLSFDNTARGSIQGSGREQD